MRDIEKWKSIAQTTAVVLIVLAALPIIILAMLLGFGLELEKDQHGRH